MARSSAMTGLDVIIEDARWTLALGEAAAFAETCRAAAAALEPKLAASAALLLADDATLQRLNRDFRGHDKPTNVLSFPAGEGAGAFLGDIAMAYDVCAREAGDEAGRFRDHAAHLIIHGLLHLAGYDHETDEEAERMERLETRILAGLGVADPYADAAGAETADAEAIGAMGAH